MKNDSVDLSAYIGEMGFDILRILDIRDLPNEESRGFPTAIVFARSLPRIYFSNPGEGPGIDRAAFDRAAERIDEDADRVADEICRRGYRAISQSEERILQRNEYREEQKRTPLPNKTLAVRAGIGWIGKSSLLVTEEYGAALLLGAVLTDLPLRMKPSFAKASQCGNCVLCVRNCPVKVLHGATWKDDMKRDQILDVFRCEKCLQCLVCCKFSKEYILDQSSMVSPHRR